MQALAAAFLALFCLVAAAQVPQPPEIAARAYLLLDVTANQMLAARDIDAPVEPASLTKLMTRLPGVRRAAQQEDRPEADAAGQRARLEDARVRACSSTPACRCRWKT